MLLTHERDGFCPAFKDAYQARNHRPQEFSMFSLFCFGFFKFRWSHPAKVLQVGSLRQNPEDRARKFKDLPPTSSRLPTLHMLPFSVPLFQWYLKGFPLVCSIQASKKLKGSDLLTETEMLVTSPPLGYFPLRTFSQFSVLAALAIFPRVFLPLPSPSV